MTTILADLDELVLTVRDRVSRSYIQEAVAAYRGQAFRAAVVAAWIAVVFDLIAKFRDLASHGDAEARNFVRELDNAIGGNNVIALQKFEAKILEYAQTQLELLTATELTALVRLKEDRHHCAHPAFDTEGSLFSPSPEAVRAHIVHAITSLLQHPPVQGKAALAQIRHDVTQPSFPQKIEDAINYMRGKYLDRARPSLVESLTVVLIKALINRDDPDWVGYEPALSRCLQAVLFRHPTTAEPKAAEQLRRLAIGADDAKLRRVFSVIKSFRRAWDWIDQPVRLRLVEIARTATYADVLQDQDGDLILIDLIDFAPLKDAISESVSRMDDDTATTVIQARPRKELAERAVTVFAGAKSFRHAESLTHSILLPLARHLSAHQVRRAIEAISTNAQIQQAYGVPPLIATFFDRTQHVLTECTDAWQSLMKKVLENDNDEEAHYCYPHLRKQMQGAEVWPPF